MSLSELRPLSMGEILDGAFTLYRRHPGVMAGTALLAYAPAMVMWAWFAVLGGAEADAESLTLLSRALRVLGAVVCAGALTQQANAAYRGGEVSVSEGLRLVRESFGRLLGAIVLKGAMILVGFFLLVVPGIVFALKFFAIVPAVVVEGQVPSAAATRSSDLSRGATGRVGALVVMLYLLAWIPATAVSYAADGAAALLHPSDTLATALSQVAFCAARAVMEPVSAAAVLLLYYDRRVRAEALDLDTSAAALA